MIARRVRQPSITTCPSRASTAAIRRSAPSARRQRLREREVRLPAREERRSDDHLQRATVEHRRRAIGGAHAAADPAGQPARRSTRPAPGCRRCSSPRRDRSAGSSESRSNLRTQPSMSSVATASRSPCTSCTICPPWRSIEGISMRSATSLTGRCRDRADTTFELGDGVLAEVKDRRGQRGVGLARREDVVEVLERAGAAGGDHRDRHRGGHRGGQLAVEPARACRRDRSRSAGSLPRRARPPRSPTRRHRGPPPRCPLRANTA